MAILPSDTPLSEIIDATMDATDVARKFGYDDGVAGIDQCGSVYFTANTPAWHAYNEGYRDGTRAFVAKTGKTRRCIVAGHRRLDIETIDALSPFAGAFQGDYSDATGNLRDEPGYGESTTPYLY